MSSKWQNASGPRNFGGAMGDHRPFETSSNDMTHYHSVGQSNGRHSSDTQAKIKHLTTFFGEPNPMRKYEFDNAPYESENQDYPEAFTKLWGSNGRSGAAGFQSNEYIRKVLIEKTKASENWQLTVMAPWTEHKGGGLSFSWEEIRFNRHMLDREPEESVPRLMTQTATSGSASMVRYGISLLLEANFAATPIGQQTYLMNLEQIRVATVETCSYGVMVSIMEHTPYHNSYNIAHQQAEQRDKQKLDEMFKEECSSFGMAHKEADSYELIKSKLKGILASRCNTDEGNFTVLPEGMGKFVQRSRDVKYYLDGRSRASNISGLDRPADQTIVDSRAFSQGEWTPGHDPCFRHVTIGGFSTLDDSSLLNMEVEKYRTWMLNFMGYDEDSDDFYEFRYKDIYQKVGWWNFKQPGAPITEKLGKQYAYDFQCYTWGQLARRNASDYDKFIHKLSLLTPEQQQQCLSTLRLLPKGHDLADHRNTGENFSRRAFDSMVDGDIQWDKQYTVSQRKNFKRKAERGETIGNSDDDAKEYQSYMDSQYETPEDPIDPMTAFDEGDDLMDVDPTPPDEYKVSYSLDHNQPVVSRYRPSQTVNRIVPRKAAPSLTTAAVEAAPSLREKDLMEKEAAALLKFVHAGTSVPGEIMTLKQAQDLDKSTRLASVGNLVASFLATATTVPDASPETLRMLVSTLRSIVQKEVIEVTKKDKPEEADIKTVLIPALQSKIVASFVPILGRVQMPLVFQGVHMDHTPLERAMKGSASELDNIKDSAAANAGWWNPTGTKDNEDGQIRLMVDSIRNGVGLPLPHDSYATTLAANHHVLFSMERDAKIFDSAGELVIGGGLKQSRTDSLVYSIILSLVAANRLKTTTTAAGSMTNPGWLKRIARVKAMPLLPSQAHLSGVIQSGVATINDWLAKGKTMFKLSTPNDVVFIQDIYAKASATATELADAALYIQRLVVNDGDMDTLDKVIRSGYTEPVKAQKQTRSDVSDELTPVLLVDGSSDYVSPGVTSTAGDAVMYIAASLASKIFLSRPMQSWNSALDKESADVVTVPGSSQEQQRAIISRIRPLLIKYYQKKLGHVALETSVPATSWTRTIISNLLDRASLVSGSFFRFCVDNDVPLPLAMRLWRPSKTYNMGSVIRMTAGANGAAKTFVSVGSERE